MNSDQLLRALIVNRLPALRALEKRTLFDAPVTVDEYRTITLPKIESIVNRRLRPRSFDTKAILFLAHQDYRCLHMRSIRAILVERMPFLLQNIFDPPFLLFVRGNLAIAEEKVLAVVGTRGPSAAAARAAFAIGRDIAEERLVLVSGLAKGVDGMVMGATVDGGGRVIAVLGNGIDYIYPRQHRRLAERILEHDGVILSEYPPGVEPMRHHFPSRNRIISALARAVLVIEAPRRSGALITARSALDQGRDLFVHAVSTEGTHASAGSRALIADGAPVISSIRQLRSLWGYTGMDDMVREPLSAYTPVFSPHTILAHSSVHRSAQ